MRRRWFGLTGIFQLTVQLSLIFLIDRGDPQDASDLRLSSITVCLRGEGAGWECVWRATMAAASDELLRLAENLPDPVVEELAAVGSEKIKHAIIEGR